MNWLRLIWEIICDRIENAVRADEATHVVRLQLMVARWFFFLLGCFLVGVHYVDVGHPERVKDKHYSGAFVEAYRMQKEAAEKEQAALHAADPEMVPALPPPPQPVWYDTLPWYGIVCFSIWLLFIFIRP